MRETPHLAHELWAKEALLLHERRHGVEPEKDAPLPEIDQAVGLAFSGGGIRSATISVGVLQGLAHHGALRAIDYVSTVSGGGYAGTFLGGLFTRWGKSEGEKREGQWDTIEEALKNPGGHPIDWLRENGRYLAPNGASDMWVATAVVLRNLFAVHVILGTFVLALLLATIRARLFVTTQTEELLLRLTTQTLGQVFAGHAMWWSPILVLPAVMFAFWLLPVGVAFWLVQPSSGRPGLSIWRDRIAPALPVPLIAIASGVFAYTHRDDWQLVLAGGAVGLCMVMSMLFWVVAVVSHALPEEARNYLTLRLKTAVVATLVLATLGLLDSLGQTVYVVWVHGKGPGAVVAWMAGGFSALAGVASLAQRLFGALAASSEKKKKGRLPLQLIASVAAFLLVSVMVTSLSALAHALTWKPMPPPAVAVEAPDKYQVTFAPGMAHVREVKAPAAACHVSADDGGAALCIPRDVDWTRLRWALLAAFVLTVAFGQTYSFLNRSSLAGLYGARLERCYLGASNEQRKSSEKKNVTMTFPGDELEVAKYVPWTRGGPLHIVNATLNETINGRSQVEQRDRKGMALALGPAGISVGVKHHAAWEEGQRGSRLIPTVSPDGPTPPFRVFPRARVESADAKEPGALVSFSPVVPSMGGWMAISGAAVATGLGYLTSAGLSLLIGLFNVRLGQWFRSGVEPRLRAQTSAVGAEAASGAASKTTSRLARSSRLFSWLLPVYAHFFNELLARFPGVTIPDWYLSDGGHFENTGAYELVRRRVPFIILCDNGADAERTFDDLGNFVRKVRQDFGAHVEFLGPDAIRAAGKGKVLGTLADLGFAGHFEPGSAVTPAAPPKPADSEEPARATRYATLARITYEGPKGNPPPPTTLLILRPAVLGEEPLDILNYQIANPAFPQESTGDQFFDEAQWEAYRRLGQYMACSVFSELTLPGKPRLGWSPVTLSGTPLDGRGCASAPD